MPYKMNVDQVQLALDAVQRYKAVVIGSSDARKPDVQTVLEWSEASSSADEAEVITKRVLVPHPAPLHPDDKSVLHTMRRFRAVLETHSNRATGFEVAERATAPRTVHKADLVTLCGGTFHKNELKQMVKAASGIYDL